MQRFAFKPALLRGERVFELDEVGLTEPEADLHIAWADVKAAAFVDLTARGMRIRRLDLTPRGGGEKLQISVTTGDASPPVDPDAIAFLRMASTALERLEDAQPGFEVTFGEYGTARILMFAVGVLSVIGALGILLVAAIAGISSDRWLAGIVPMLLLLGFGGVIMVNYAPWVKPPKMPARVMAKALRLLVDG